MLLFVSRPSASLSLYCKYMYETIYIYTDILCTVSTISYIRSERIPVGALPMAPEQPKSDKELMERNPNLLKLSRMC